MFQKKLHLIITIITILSIVLTGCLGGETKKEEVKYERVLKIATINGEPNDPYLRSQYADLFEFSHPNIKLEFIPVVDYFSINDGESQINPVEKLKEIMKGSNPPDVVIFEYDFFEELINDNYLTSLDTYIEQDDFDTGKIVKPVIEGFKEIGNGSIYGLTPTFNSTALIYNKDIFDKFNVQYPSDNMTWQEIMDLAKRLTIKDGDKQIHGLSFSMYGGSFLYSMEVYTNPLELNIFDEKLEKMLVDNDEWEKVWNDLKVAYDQKIFPPLEQNFISDSSAMASPFYYNDFLSGRVAMTVIDHNDIHELVNANKSADKVNGYTKINYDIVTLPVHGEAPGVGGQMSFSGILGINVNAQNTEDAWEYIKFINGDDFAKIKSKSSYEMVTRTNYIHPIPGENYNVQAFTQLKLPRIIEDPNLMTEHPELISVKELGKVKFREVLEGKKEVRQALKEWQVEGSNMLHSIKESKSNHKEVDPTTSSNTR